MNYYVIATDRDGCEMTRGDMMFHKKVFACGSLREAEQVARMLRERPVRFGAVQTTPRMPVFNPKVYSWSVVPGAAWARCA